MDIDTFPITAFTQDLTDSGSGPTTVQHSSLFLAAALISDMCRTRNSFVGNATYRALGCSHHRESWQQPDNKTSTDKKSIMTKIGGTTIRNTRTTTIGTTMKTASTGSI